MWIKAFDGTLVNINNISHIAVRESEEDTWAIVAFTINHAAIHLYDGTENHCRKKLSILTDTFADNKVLV